MASGTKAETEDKEGFQSALQAWFEAYEGFLNERTVNEETGGSHYTHKKLRSTYLSLKRNLDDLFTFEAHPALGIHNTTNLLDGRFADLKRKLGCHHGIKMENKVRFIKDYFSINRGLTASILSYRSNVLQNSSFFLSNTPNLHHKFAVFLRKEKNDKHSRKA